MMYTKEGVYNYGYTPLQKTSNNLALSQFRLSSRAPREDEPRAIGVGLGEPRRDVDGKMRVVGIEHVVVFHFSARGVDVGAGGDLMGFGADDVTRARFQVEREERDRRVVGHADGLAAASDGVVGDEREEVVLNRLLTGEFGEFAVRRVVLGGGGGEERHEHERTAGHP